MGKLNAGLAKYIASHKKGVASKSKGVSKGSVKAKTSAKSGAKISGKAYWAKVKAQGHR